MNHDYVRPYLLVFFAGSIWGLTFSFARLASQGGAHPLGLTFYQGLGGALVLGALCLLQRRRFRLDREFLRFYVILGLLGTALPGALFFYAAPHVPAGVLAITVAMVPILTYAGSWLLSIDGFSLRRAAGILSGLLAVTLLVGPETSLPDPSMVFWILLVLLASVFYTFENIYVAIRVPADTDMIALLCGMLLTAGLLMLPVVLTLDAFVAIGWPWGTTEWSIVGMAFVSSIAYAMFLKVIQDAGPVFASQTGYIVTLSGVIWAMLIFQERHSYWVWMALVLMLSGVALVTPRRAPTTPAATGDAVGSS